MNTHEIKLFAKVETEEDAEELRERLQSWLESQEIDYYSLYVGGCTPVVVRPDNG